MGKLRSTSAPGRRLQVLLVEDDEDDAVLLARKLRRDGLQVEMTRVDSAKTMRGALERQPWDVILSDFTIPRFSGLAAFELLKGTGLDIPFIFVSGTVGEETAVKAMKLGASDYFIKGNLARLAPAIEREVRERDSRAARARAEQELRQAEARYGELFEAAPFPMFVVDSESLGFLAANDEAVSHYGYSRRELATLGAADLRVPQDGAGGQERPSDPPRSPDPFASDGRVAVSHRKKDGTVIRVEEKSHTIQFAGRAARLVAVTDVTERLRAQEALEAKEEQLRQSQKMEAVGRLAGGVAHDFNNMLSVILSYAEMAASKLHPDDECVGHLREIRSAGKRAAELTKQLLLFSRQQVLERQVLDLNALVAGTEKLCGRILGEDVELVCRPADAPARIRANPGHIEQVLINLVVNARDAMPTGGKLTIQTSNVVLAAPPARCALPVPAGSYVLVTVTDTGSGIDRATQARIFEPFFTTKERGKGTGLGLSTVFGIVQQSGGTIAVQSEVGKGTSFRVYFPRVDAAVDARSVTAPPPTLRGTETILVVEDEDRVRIVVRSILRRSGYEVLEASSSEEALRLCAQHPEIHMLLSDIVMPRMGGPELSRRIGKDKPNMRVLFMSGYTDDSLAGYALDAREAFLQKPFTPGSLTRKVREVLDSGSRPAMT